MALPLVDYLDLPDGGHLLTEEAHVISATAHVDLYELPKVLSSATSATENVWLSVSEAAALITVEYDNGGTWTALTLTDTTPTATEYAVQCADGVKYPYSPRLLFHADLAGASARVTYTGLGSVPLAAWFTTLEAKLDRLTATGELSLFAADTSGIGMTTRDLYLSPSRQLVIGSTGLSAMFPGEVVSFGSVAAFQYSGYWKRVTVCLNYTGAWVISLLESAETSSQLLLTTPAAPIGWYSLGYVDVHHDGGSVPSTTFLPITQASVVSQLWLPGLQLQTVPIILTYDGDLFAGQEVGAIALGIGWELVSITVCARIPGTAGTTRIGLLRYSTEDETEFAVIATEANRPTIAASASANRIDITPAADCTAGMTTFGSGHVLRCVLETVATGAQSLSMTIWARCERV